ncbi:MAG: YraN family protein [Alphaproteobacteria bacterium]|nr:YraN family protein [Alphaproteobacteria bacterium]
MRENDGAKRRRAQSLGRLAESQCVATLREAGWSILARRFRCGRGVEAGEIDLIARQGHLIAFIEVKARDSLEAALAAVSPRQRARIAQSADVFLQGQPELAACDCRFDVMVLLPGCPPHHVADAWRVGD